MQISHILRIIEERGVDAVEDEEIEVKAFETVDKEFVKRLRRTVVCLANSKGGYLVLGVNESTNKIEGCPNIDPMELSNIVYEGTKPGILLEFEAYKANDGAVVYHARVPRSPRIHATSDGARYHRVGKKCMPLYPDEEYRLLMDRGTLDITNQPVERIGLDDLRGDMVREIATMRSERQVALGVKVSGTGTDPEEVLGSIGALTEDDRGEARLTIAGAILGAEGDKVMPVIPGRKLIYVLMEGDSEYRERKEWDGPMITAVEEVVESIMRNSKVSTLRIGVVQREIPEFPPNAIREVIVNAVAHRDYLINAPIIVRQYSDRMEVTSPGQFVGGITADNILHHNPTHRNPALVRIMHQLGLVEEIGIGVDRVYEALLRSGKEPPMFESLDDQVTCTIPNGSLDEAFVRFIEERSGKGEGMSLDELIVIHHVKMHQSIERATASRIIQRPDAVATTVLSGLVDRNILKRIGTRGGSYYTLSDETARELGTEMRDMRHPVIDDLRSQALIMEASRSMGTITNNDVRELLGVNRYKALRYLDTLVDKGELKREGTRRWTRYIPAE
jgi:ATP-dependent DNA helicase RecG